MAITPENQERLADGIRCAGILIVRTNPSTQRREFLVAKRLVPPDEGKDGMPGGKEKSPDETPLEIALREVREETGIIFSETRLRKILDYDQCFSLSQKRYLFCGYVVELDEGEEFEFFAKDPAQTHGPWEWVSEDILLLKQEKGLLTLNLEKMISVWKNSAAPQMERFLGEGDGGVLKAQVIVNRLFDTINEIPRYSEMPDSGPI